MPEFDDTFLFECAKFERKKWKSYNISLRPSSIAVALKSVGSFSPTPAFDSNCHNSKNNNNNNTGDSYSYFGNGKDAVQEDDPLKLVGGRLLRPTADPLEDPASPAKRTPSPSLLLPPPVVRRRDLQQQHRNRYAVVSHLYGIGGGGGSSPLREKFLGFKRHSYTPGSGSSTPSTPPTSPFSTGSPGLLLLEQHYSTTSEHDDLPYCDNGSTTTISVSAGGTPRNSASSTGSSGVTENGTDGGGGKQTPVTTPGAPGSSGHKGSIRGNKLARRARSFKDDFLEKISQIRTPTNTMTRSHSPNSPRAGTGSNRNSGDLLTGNSKPVQDLAYHVRQVKNALTHFKDVILKNKLEMLPGNGTVVLELIANVHTALQSYTLNENSSALINATNHVYMSLGNLLKLCDEVLLATDNENCPSLSKENVKEIVELVDNAVNNLVNLANEKLSDKAAGSSNNSSNTLQRPTVDIAGQRTSLPDIPLTPRERDILEQTSLKTVRASHSTESILRDSSPPPKPPLPDRGQDPPPLPPKRKSQHAKNHSFHETASSDCNSDSTTFLGCGALDRMSLRSRSPEDNSSLLSASAGSLDSALNHSREEEELRALTANHDKSTLGGNHSSAWDESDCTGNLLLSGISGAVVPCAIPADITVLNNRNSNESGFESMCSLRISRDHQSSSTYKSATYSSNSSSSQQQHIHKSESILDSMMGGGSGKIISMVSASSQHQQSHQQQHHQKIDTVITQASGDSGDHVVLNTATVTSSCEVSSSSSRIQKSRLMQYGSIEANDEVFGLELGGGDKPPALPVKTRSHSIRRERHPSQYDNVDEAELERSSQDTFNSCMLHQQTGYHSRQQMINNLPSKHISLIEPRHMNHFSEEPPPLPMKKKHMFQSVAYSVMAYMEIFGSATQNHSEFMRHSVHTYNLSHGTATGEQLQQQQHQLQLQQQHHQQHQISSSSMSIMVGGISQQNISHSQTMSLSPSRILPPPISPPSSPSLNVKPPALPPKRQRINSKTPSITSTPPASPKVFGSSSDQNTPSSPSPSRSPSQHHSSHHNSCSSPSPSSTSIGTLLPTPPPKNQQQPSVTGSPEAAPPPPPVARIKVSPVAAGDDKLLLVATSPNNSSNNPFSSSSATSANSPNSPHPHHTQSTAQFNNFNNINNNQPQQQQQPQSNQVSNSSSHSSILASNNLVGVPPLKPPSADEDYLHLCDTSSPALLSQQQQRHHSRVPSDVSSGGGPTNLTSSSNSNPLVNNNNNNINNNNNQSNNHNSNRSSVSSSTTTVGDPGGTGGSARKSTATDDDEVEVVLRRNNKNGITLIEQQQSIQLMEDLDVSNHLVFKKENEDGPDVKGGHPDALIIHATKVQKISDVTDEFLEDAYGEAFITTFRTFISPLELIQKLTHRYSIFHCQMIDAKQKAAKESFSLLVRVVNDLTSPDLSLHLLEILMSFVYQLVCAGHLTMAKLLRVKLIEKAALFKQKSAKDHANQALSCRAIITSPPTLLDLKSIEIAEQMTLLDAELFHKIEIPEVLIWAQEQNEERSPNLTTFTEHFNKMSYWARSQILRQREAKDREKYVIKFIKIMKHLRKMNNYNSYLALLSALDSAPIRRLEWHRTITEGLKEYCALIDSSSSFRAYRQALAETNPPCIPYIGLVLQDLTFVHIGNPDLLSDGSINFSKRWQQYHIVVNMKRFKKGSYQFKKNEKIIGFFDNFEDYLDEDAMWQISEDIKPRGGRKPNPNSN
ncbi:guanine nucleotide-releasing factor 2 isoform X2 [Uranotaenia lowii]|uniref:guanine nucleotide-releasing factor 2 isoform X2 n=1 Tax=Uranotaenia lowii TaxID=190385 RepID=UPI00247B0EDE|nr:guanine nucleotide-releasing factor 2 isoform X2 [Uranotaenia lowii]